MDQPPNVTLPATLDPEALDGAALLSLRRAAGLRQSDVTDVADLCHGTLSSVERGWTPTSVRGPRWSTVLGLLRALGYTVRIERGAS